MERYLVPAQDRSRSRNRYGKKTMLAVYSSCTFRKVRDDHIRDPQIVDAESCSRYVQDGIHRADFMEMNPVDRLSMDLRLRLRNDPEDPERDRKRILTQRARAQDRLDVRQVPPMMMVVMVTMAVAMLTRFLP